MEYKLDVKNYLEPLVLNVECQTRFDFCDEFKAEINRLIMEMYKMQMIYGNCSFKFTCDGKEI